MLQIFFAVPFKSAVFAVTNNLINGKTPTDAANEIMNDFEWIAATGG